MTPASPTRARLELAGAAVLFSTGGAAIKWITLSGWQVAGLRSLVAAAAIFLVLPGARHGYGWRAALVGLAYAGTLVLFVTATKLTTSANAIFLQSTAPAYILVLGPWLLRERLSRSDLTWMAIVMLGLLCFFVGTEAPRRTAPDPLLGNLLAAGSGVTWAFTIIGLRWMGAAGRPGGAAPSLVIGNLIAFLVCLPFVAPLGEVRVADFVAIGYLGVFQIGGAYALMSAGVRGVSALEASLILLVEPVLNPIFSWLVHGEVPGRWALAGGAVVLGATIVRSAREARRSAQATLE